MQSAARPPRPRSGLPAVFVVALLLVPAALPAQEILGRLIDPGTGEPVAGASITLLDPSSERAVGGSLTDDGGYFRIRAPASGSYVLRADRIGHASTFSDEVVLGAGEVVEVELEAAVEAVSLEGIEVTGDRRCDIRPEEGVETFRVWEEARKALSAATWTGRNTYTFRVMSYTRVLGPGLTRVHREDRTFETRPARHGYVAPATDELLEEGFVRVESSRRDSIRYFGPDLRTLLSDVFLDTHCFRLVRGEGDTGGFLGLTFEPLEGRDVADIEGTLWMEPDSALLRRIDYEYTGLFELLDYTPRVAGGRIVFDRLANGAWYTQEWWIRAPILEERPSPTGSPWPEVYEDGAIEQGGMVVRATDPSDRVLAGAVGGIIEGTVVDSTGTEILRGARVRVVGTDQERGLDPEGRFRFDELLGGTYEVAFTHPILDSLGTRAAPVEVMVERGRVARVTLRAPSRSELLARTCRARGTRTAGRGGVPAETEEAGEPTAPDPEGGILLGTVREPASGLALGTARIVAEWTERAPDGGARPRRREATVRGDGTYVLCDLPGGAVVSVWAEALGRRSDRLTAEIREGGFVRRPLTVSLPAGVARSGEGDVVGRVYDRTTGRPVEGAVVRVGADGPQALTNRSGHFRIEGVAAGAYPVEVEHLGYAAPADSVRVLPGQALQVEVPLAPEAIELAPLEVTVRSLEWSARMAGVLERMEGVGGEFILRPEIEQRGSPPLTSLLDGRAGIQLKRLPGDMGSYLPVFRRAWRPSGGDCSAAVYLDGRRYPLGPRGLDGIVTLDIEAIEIYRGPASVPGEFGGSDSGCGVLAIWTR